MLVPHSPTDPRTCRHLLPPGEGLRLADPFNPSRTCVDLGPDLAATVRGAAAAALDVLAAARGDLDTLQVCRPCLGVRVNLCMQLWRWASDVCVQVPCPAAS